MTIQMKAYEQFFLMVTFTKCFFFSKLENVYFWRLDPLGMNELINKSRASLPASSFNFFRHKAPWV